MKYLIKYILITVWFFFGAGVFSLHARELPWEVGEKLTFSVRWGIIRAGVATLEVRDSLSLGGRSTFRIVHTARTARFFDPFFKVRNRVESFIDAEELHSVRYERIIREGGYSKDSVIIYNHEFGLAYEDGEMFQITRGVQDVLSSFYYLRTMDLEMDQIYEFDVGSDKEVWPLEVKVLGREEITVPAGTFKTIVVEPRLREDEGIFKHEGEITIWLTDDKRRIPVLVRSEIKIGAISIYLTDKDLPGKR